MRWIVFAGQIAGALSSLLVSWGFGPPTGAATWISGDEGIFARSRRWRILGVRAGFALLALGFALQAIVTWHAR